MDCTSSESESEDESNGKDIPEDDVSDLFGDFAEGERPLQDLAEKNNEPNADDGMSIPSQELPEEAL